MCFGLFSKPKPGRKTRYDDRQKSSRQSRNSNHSSTYREYDKRYSYPSTDDDDDDFLPPRPVSRLSPTTPKPAKSSVNHRRNHNHHQVQQIQPRLQAYDEPIAYHQRMSYDAYPVAQPKQVLYPLPNGIGLVAAKPVPRTSPRSSTSSGHRRSYIEAAPRASVSSVGRRPFNDATPRSRGKQSTTKNPRRVVY